MVKTPSTKGRIMFKFLRSHDSILVGVHDGRYDCYADINPANARLAEVLQQLGGVSDTVPDGYYWFNAIRRGFVMKYTLTPYEE